MGMTTLLIGTGLKGFGYLYEGQAAYREGKAAQEISEYNARVMEQEAEAATDKALFEMGQTGREGQRRVSSLIAATGASGVQLGVGAPQRLIEEQRAEIELQKLIQGYEGETMASRARSEAAQYRMQGEYAKMRGESARTASYFGFGSSLLEGFGTYDIYRGLT